MFVCVLQVDLAASAATFTALITVVCLLVGVTFLLSLIAGLRANCWLVKVLDADNDGKISSNDLYTSASKLLHLNMSSPGKAGEGSSSGTLVTGSAAGSRIASWRLVFVGGGKSKAKLGGSGSGSGGGSGEAVPAAVGSQDSGTADQAVRDQQGLPAAAAAGLRGRGGVTSFGKGLAAGSLPIAAGMTAASGDMAAAAAGNVITSASIDIGALNILRAAGGDSGVLLHQLQAAAAPHGEGQLGWSPCRHAAADLSVSSSMAH